MSQQAGPGRWIYVAIIVSIFVLANGFLVFYVTLKPDTNLQRLEEQISGLETQLQSLNTQLKNRAFLNQSGTNILSKVFSLTKGSLVLIENRVQTIQGLQSKGLGSGFVYSVDSVNQYVVTNNHVVEGASDILVTFMDGNSTTANVIGTDKYSDLAVVRLSRPMPWLKPLALGNSSALKIGETVIALGNPFGLSGTVTSGIVSQLDRDLDASGNYKIIDVIQIDAAINPGNSGGPLVNLLGEVIGINTAIISESDTSSGVGFAIASNTIAREAPSLIVSGKYEHPYLGISGADVDYDIAQAASLSVPYGFLVGSMPFNSPAAQAGIRGGTNAITVLDKTVTVGGDLIVGINGILVRQLNDISLYLERNNNPGDRVTLTIIRGNQKLSAVVTLGTRPAS
jgi:S1-C subfamily serine protease